MNDLTVSIECFDGERKRTLWVSNELLAEIEPSDAGRAALLAFDKDAQDRPTRQRGVRVWRVRAAQGVDGAARALSRDSLRFSPVLHDSASSSAPIAALPGGVVATFERSWDRARIDAWLAARELSVSEVLVADANMFLIATVPGLESVTIANRLHATGELVACTPNLWREAATR